MHFSFDMPLLKLIVVDSKEVTSKSIGKIREICLKRSSKLNGLMSNGIIDTLSFLESDMFTIRIFDFGSDDWLT